MQLKRAHTALVNSRNILTWQSAGDRPEKYTTLTSWSGAKRCVGGHQASGLVGHKEGNRKDRAAVHNYHTHVATISFFDTYEELLKGYNQNK